MLNAWEEVLYIPYPQSSYSVNLMFDASIEFEGGGGTLLFLKGQRDGYEKTAYASLTRKI